MRATSFVRVFLAACYVAIYVYVFAVAWHGRHGGNGGMAFGVPIVLGFQWTPLMVCAAMLLPKAVAEPDDVARALQFIAFFIIPPALNTL